MGLRRFRLHYEGGSASTDEETNRDVRDENDTASSEGQPRKRLKLSPTRTTVPPSAAHDSDDMSVDTVELDDLGASEHVRIAPSSLAGLACSACM